MTKKKGLTAAGTVTISRSDAEVCLLVVHRPRYDDWSLPKGKLSPDEYEPAAACRETHEETGVRVRLGVPAGVVTYPVEGVQKTVHFWAATPLAREEHEPDDEVDRVEWLAPEAALDRLTYDDERAVASAVLDRPPTVPFVIVRHAKAMERKHWTGRDQARPINGRGRKQSKALVPLLDAYDLGRLVSSTSVRCMQTLKPYARRRGTDVEGWAVLSEEVGDNNPAAVATVMRRFVAETLASGVPTVVCGHRPVLPTMLTTLGVPPRPLQPAAAVVVHLTLDGQPAAVEWIRPKV